MLIWSREEHIERGKSMPEGGNVMGLHPQGRVHTHRGDGGRMGHTHRGDGGRMGHGAE